MKKLLISSIAALGLIGTPAFAADMAVKVPPPAPAPIHNWTGWYVGLNAGGGWQNTTIDNSVISNSTVNGGEALIPALNAAIIRGDSLVADR